MKKYSHIGKPRGPLDAQAWEDHYRTGDTPWDHGEPSPGLVDFLAQEKYKPGRILVPGCGAGHDCRELARHGFKVTGLDISKRALTMAKKLEGHAPSWPPVRYQLGDFLAPSTVAALYERRESAPQRRSQTAATVGFDWLFEHTCFCAITPELRDRYVEAAAAALKPGGYLLGIFFIIRAKEGPPFGATGKELLERFSPRFDLVMKKVPRSWPNRKGEELLMLWRKKN